MIVLFFVLYRDMSEAGIYILQTKCKDLTCSEAKHDIWKWPMARWDGNALHSSPEAEGWCSPDLWGRVLIHALTQGQTRLWDHNGRR